MVKEKKVDSVELDRLYGFLDGLKTNGYKIDIRQYMALNDLLISLAARGETIFQLPLKTLIAPIICTTPLEQQDFYQRFDRWAETLNRLKESQSEATETQNTHKEELSNRVKTNRTTRMVVNILGLGIFFIVAIFIAQSLIVSMELLTPDSITLIYYVVIGLIGAAIAILTYLTIRQIQFFILRIRDQIKKSQYITRELAKPKLSTVSVPIQSYLQEIFPIGKIKTISRTLRKRTQVQSTEVDIQRSIENALNRNLWLEIKYRHHQIVPEYVVLIDRKGRHDQQARFIQEMLAKLAAEGVWLHLYEFSGDPRICFPIDRKDKPLRLKDIHLLHPDSRLLLFSGAYELVNPITGLLQEWVEVLFYWHERTIMTPDKFQKMLVEELKTQDFSVLPLSFDGLASVVRVLEKDNHLVLKEIQGNIPSPLTERPLRWTGRTQPPQVEIDSLIGALRTYLGENGFFWLCATAVYPELDWNLTIHLGSALGLLAVDSLLRLVQLPWFRIGYMPDWFRLSLINNFTRSQEENTRIELRQLLSAGHHGNSFELLFSQLDSDSIISQIRRMMLPLAWKLAPNDNLKEEIFIKFVLTPTRKRLSVAFPQVIQETKETDIASGSDHGRYKRENPNIKLLKKYEPVLRFAKSERFFPMAVEPYLEKCTLFPSGPSGAAELIGSLNEPLSKRIGKLIGHEFFLRFVNKPLFNSDAWVWWGIGSALGLVIGWFTLGITGLQVAIGSSLSVALVIFLLASPIRLRVFPVLIVVMAFLAFAIAPIWVFFRPIAGISIAIEYYILLPIYFVALYYVLLRVLRLIFNTILPEGPGLIFDMLSQATERVAKEAWVLYSEILRTHPQPVYYGRVHREMDMEGNQWTILQYHYFYAFNDWRLAANGFNHREGDWQNVAVYLINDIPHSVFFSQHNTGNLQKWENIIRVTDENGDLTLHPIIYSALGSHANYSQPDVIRSPAMYRPGRLQRFLFWFDGWIHYLFLLFNPSQKARQIALEGMREKTQQLFKEHALDDMRDETDQYIVRLPMDFATGDGLRVGFQGKNSKEPVIKSSRYLKRVMSERRVSVPSVREWQCILLDSEQEWLQYKGLWGVKSILREESGSTGPKWDRPRSGQKDSQERVRWGFPLKWLEYLEK